MKKENNSLGSFFHEVAKVILGLLVFGGIIGFFILDHGMFSFGLAGVLLIFFGGAAKLMQYILKTGQEPTEQEIPWAERVRQGLEPLEGSDQPKPEEMPWAERVRAGLESLSLEEDPPPAESHDHIPSTALEKDEKLEQLKVLLAAGLIDREEYEQKKREIRKER